MHKNNSSVMKRWFAGLSTAFIMTLSGLVSVPAYAQGATSRFYCGKYSNGEPATIVDNGRGRQIALILWGSTYFSSSGYTPEKRCEIVSKNFAQALEKGSLRYLTYANLNGYPVICASKAKEGVCDRLLFTLNRGEDPSGVLIHLVKIRKNASVKPLYSSPIVSSGNRSVINSCYADRKGRNLNGIK